VGSDYISTDELLEYQDAEDGFRVKNPNNGKFEEAYSIDFEDFISVGSAEIVPL